MSLFINGADQDTFTMNGTEIDNLYVDNVLVFSSGEAIAPNAPTNFVASDNEAEQITFTWDNSTVGFPTPTYDIYRFNQPLLIATDVTSPHTEAIEIGTNDYIVRAINSEGQADSNVDSGTSVTAPVITILGTSPVDTEINDVYVDDGATATDVIDGDITNQIVTDNQVVEGVVGSYNVTYTVENSVGSEAEPVTRVVNVVATGVNEPPVITILGDNPATVVVGNTYNDEGATAMDPQDGDLTGSITTVNNVDINITGDYQVTYEVSDSDGNTTIKIRDVQVVSEILPPIYDFSQPLIDKGDGYLYVYDVANNPYEDHDGKLCLANGDPYIPTEAQYDELGWIDLSDGQYITTAWTPSDSLYEWTLTSIYSVDNNSYTMYTFHFDGIDKLDVYIGSNNGTTQTPVAYSHTVQPYTLQGTEWVVTDTPPAEAIPPVTEIGEPVYVSFGDPTGASVLPPEITEINDILSFTNTTTVYPLSDINGDSSVITMQLLNPFNNQGTGRNTGTNGDCMTDHEFVKCFRLQGGGSEATIRMYLPAGTFSIAIGALSSTTSVDDNYTTDYTLDGETIQINSATSNGNVDFCNQFSNIVSTGETFDMLVKTIATGYHGVISSIRITEV